jgi:cytoskeleton protein RodZ
MSGDRAPADLGSKLRQARERRGLSIGQIATSTKISVSILEALERNDLGRLPGGVFSRAFVRSFAVQVGLDPDAAVEQFAAQSLKESVAVGRSHALRVEDNDAFESDRQIASAFVRLSAVSVAVAALMIYFGATGRRSQPAGTNRTTADAAGRNVSAPAASEPASVGIARDTPVVVSLLATRACRISVTIDGRRQDNLRFKAGERRIIEVHHDLLLTSDDAGAIAMTLNGEEARPLGAQGQSVTARLNPGNFKDYLPTR